MRVSELHEKLKWQAFIMFIIVFLLILLYGSFIDYQKSKPVVTALMFHSVNPEGPQAKEENGLIITPENFLNDLRYLKKQGFTFIDYKQMVSLLNNPVKRDAAAHKNILVTFDDGYSDNYFYAYPILKGESIKALIDIVVSCVEKPAPDISEHYLSWSQINEMMRSGIIQIGNHSYNSHYYVKLRFGIGPRLAGKQVKNGIKENNEDFEKKVRTDLIKSQELIMKRTSEKPEVIAFPYGKAAHEAKRIAEELGFEVQMGVKPGANYRSADLANLKRIAVKNSYSPEQLAEKIKYHIGAGLLIP